MSVLQRGSSDPSLQSPAANGGPEAPAPHSIGSLWSEYLRLPALVALLLGVMSAAAGPIPPEERRSGFDFMTPENQAMQRDDMANPGIFWVQDGEALWNRKTGAADRACADCHGDAQRSMRGVAARHPAWDETQQRPVSLEQRINLCRETRQQAPPLAWESPELLSLTAWVAYQSRGMPIAIEDERLRPAIERGRQVFERRQGQLDLSCAACHDDNWGRRLAGSVIPQGHPTGYPLYRLEWQTLGSLQRRLRNCMVGIRAEPYAYGAQELVELELYLMSRASGLPMETPGVRP